MTFRLTAFARVSSRSAQRLLTTAFSALAAMFALPANAQMTCAELASWLAKDPTVSLISATAPLAALAGTGANARCEANFIYSSRGGPDYGYDVGEQQRVQIRVGLPL